MQLSGSLFAISLIYHSAVLCESEKSLERRGKHIIALLGYLNGYKFGQNLTRHLPPILISPIIVVPMTNQEQSVNIQKNTADENYQENGGTIQRITHLSDEDNDIEVNFRQTLNRDAVKKMTQNDKVNIDLQKSDDLVDNVTTILNKTEDQTTSATVNATEVSQTEITTEVNGPYSKPVYNDSAVNTLSFTTASVSKNDLPITDDKRKNITVSANLSITTKNDTNSISLIAVSNTTEFTTVTEAFTSTTSLGPYSAALYNIAMIDQLSITTNSYTNEESPLPPPQDDRWRSFYTLKKKSLLSLNGFKPLAGLYYDGFLYKPLNGMPGFIPYKNHYYN